jgi:hypothetical protein
MKKAYHISFTFDEPRPGVITLVDETPEQAKEQLAKLLEGFNNLEIHDVTDLDDVPFLKKAFEAHQDREATLAEALEDEAPASCEPKPN